MNEHLTPIGATQQDDAVSVAELVERAFHYRGDVTVRIDDGSSVTGYLFDRDGRGNEPFAQLFEAETGREVSLPYRSIAGVLFTGRDAAAAADQRFEALQHWREEQADMGAGRHGT
ncbi:MAG: hypothetical protein OXE50_03335 [Chloroflexi bacterium]|nr:hypothetical protein [Chloroflexota bacterium]